MSQFVDGSSKSFTAGAAIGQHVRVKLVSGKLQIAGAADEDIGTLLAASFADGDVRAVRLTSAAGTSKMVAAGAIAAEATVYGAANGQIDDTATGNVVGIALEAATAAGDVIEVLRGGQTGQGAASTTAYGVVKMAASDADITDNSGGTASATIAAIGATYTQSEVQNAVASLAAEVNDLRSKMRTAGLLAP